MQDVADVEEPFLSVQLQFVQGFRLCFPAEAVELLTVNTNDIAKITAPSEHGAKYLVEFCELYLIRD
jgi:hypothetical protein